MVAFSRCGLWSAPRPSLCNVYEMTLRPLFFASANFTLAGMIEMAPRESS